MRTFSASCAVLTLAALTACANGQNVEGVQSAAGCTGCHGGQDNQTGAPPLDAHSNSTTAVATVGKHSVHVDPNGPNIACAVCHATTATGPAGNPSIVAGGTHQNNFSDLSFGSLADPLSLATFDRTSNTCSNVYCHKPFATAGTLPAPTWNDPALTITGCGACHGTPSNHSGIGTHACKECHQTSLTVVGGNPAIVPGVHVNGTVDVVAHTDPRWVTTNANGVTPHGLEALYVTTTTGLAGCRDCHGADLATPIVAGPHIPTCDACHQPYSRPGTAGTDWRTDCTFCHGDRARLADGVDASGLTSLAYAPPRDTAGNASSPQVGAHRSHLYAANAISGPVACGACHTIPTDLSHVNGTTAVAPRSPAGSPSGTYSAGGMTCASTYCHGNFTGGNVANTPVWTGAGTQTCTSCHAAPPQTGRHPGVVVGGNDVHAGRDCVNCHFFVAQGTTIKPGGRALHVNGQKDVSLSSNGTSVRVTSPPFVNGWDSATKSCSPGCHGTEVWP
jgi:predicted CxxxxCH...CXXCH cytochrome family protein